eukprot:TRINITY_DN12099_c0_g2_i1.p1 TRINITY_DN12099_c0_g2~~TRINITY_DN12099_c0_g2_i1.p1  ORF type:complete len:102 (-),score=22.27 TRINITY_DN12099_c0_g2_i1:283-588(-)
MNKTKQEKLQHNEVARRGRQKINNLINNLKDIVPALRDVECTKAVILENVVAYIHSSQIQREMFVKNCDRIKEENKRLKEMIEKLQNEDAEVNDGSVPVTE